MLKILHLLIEMLSCQLVAQSLIRLSTVCSFTVQFLYRYIDFNIVCKSLTFYALLFQ